jgi:hypothetical protein
MLNIGLTTRDQQYIYVFSSLAVFSSIAGSGIFFSTATAVVVFLAAYINTNLLFFTIKKKAGYVHQPLALFTSKSPRHMRRNIFCKCRWKVLFFIQGFIDL